MSRAGPIARRAGRVAIAVLTSRLTGAVAVIAIVIIAAFGTFRDAAQDDDTRVLACGNARFGGDLVRYFQGSLARLEARIGTSEELSTDKNARDQLQLFLNASRALSDASSSVCGPVVPVPVDNPVGPAGR